MRRVLKTANKPLEIKPQEKSVWICMCGLSKNQPYCDGSHKKVADEEDGKTYEYDSEGHRREVTSGPPLVSHLRSASLIAQFGELDAWA